MGLRKSINDVIMVVYKSKGESVMRKNFGAKTWAYPMPVFIVAAYDKNGVPCCMNAAWGGIYDRHQGKP